MDIYIPASLVAQRLKHLPAMQGDLGSIPGSGRSPGEGNGNPLQYSCLENPMGGGAWWAAVYGVAQSWTRLKQLSSSSICRVLLCACTDFLVVQTVKNLPARQETRVRSLGWGVPLKKGMAIHSTFLAWRIPWTEKPGGL